MLIIPGIILYLAFALVYPAAVLEDGSATDALKRSYNLTKGHRGNIFVATFCMGILMSIVNLPIVAVTGLLPLTGIDFWPIAALAGIVSDILSQAFLVLSLVMYLSILRTLESRQSLIE